MSVTPINISALGIANCDALELQQVISWPLPDYSYFRKCGEITVSPDEECFGFSCNFCPGICLQWDVFIQHIREQHSQEIGWRQQNEQLEMERSKQTTPIDLIMKIMDMEGMNATPDDKRIKKPNWSETNIATTKPSAAVEFENMQCSSTTKARTTTETETSSETTTKQYNSCVGFDIAPQTTMAKSQSLLNFELLDMSDFSIVSEIETPTTPHLTDRNEVGEMGMVYIVESPLPDDVVCGEESENSNIAVDTIMSTPALDPFAMWNDNEDDIEVDIVVDDNEDTQMANPRILDSAAAKTLTESKSHCNEQFATNLTDHQDEKLIKESHETELRKVTPENENSQVNTDKPITRRELERNKDTVNYLLSAYEQHEELWNPKHPEYKYNAKSSVYNVLSEPLERDLKLTVSGAEIFAVLKELRGRYRRELTKYNALGGKYKSRLWYFEHMHFLRGVIEHKRAERVAKINVSETVETDKSFETDSEHSKSAQSREALSYIIDAFKRQECLWNPHHFDYVTCNKKELYREISTQLYEDMQYEMSGEECFREIQKLRTRYRKELRMMIKHKGLYIPKLWCFDDLEFLHQILQEQIFTRISKKNGVVKTLLKSNFIDADLIEFKDMDMQLQFIEIYRNYPALWDVDHPDFRSTAYRNKALSQMLEELNTTFNTTNKIEQLEKTLFKLRKDFSAEKQKFIMSNASRSTSSLMHTKLAEFLDQNLGPFRCDVCQEHIKTSDQYKVHRSRHDGTHPFICTLCGKGFQMPCNLTVHIRRHRQDFPYACGKCDKRFATSTEVAIHMRTHTGERPYVCDLCGKSFKTWSFFDIHRRTHLNQSTFHCPICDKGFYEKNRFTDHMNGHLNIRKHLCKVCGKAFTTYGNLKKHNELHLSVKKYKCGACGKRFAQFASLRWHKKREHNSENYEQ